MKNRIGRTYRNAFVTAVYIRSSSMMAGFIDGILTSVFLGVDAMTAYTIATPYFILNSTLSYLLDTGNQILCSEKIGQGRTDEAKSVFSTTVWISFLLSALVSVAGVVYSESFAAFLGAKGEAAYLMPETAGYLRALFTGNVFYNFLSVSMGPLQMDGGTGIVRISGITTCALNIIGDLLNVFLFRGGLIGMGIATSISYVGGAAVLLLYYSGSGRLFSLRPSIRFEYIPQLFRLGYSQTVYALAAFFGNKLINSLIISGAGMEAMFGVAVFKNIALFSNTICCAVGDTTLLLIGLYTGECDRTSVNQVFRSSLWVITSMVPVCCLLAAVSRPLALFYTADHAADVLRCAQIAILAISIQIPFSALFLATLKGLQAFKKSAISSLLNLVKGCVFPCIFLLVFGKGNVGVFVSLVGAEVLSALLSSVLFLREKRQNGLLKISEKNMICAEIRTAEQAVAFSSEAGAFCANRGISSRLCFSVSLCAEELAICLLNHGKEYRIADPIVNMKMILTDEQIILRICDNCPLNDLRRRAEEWTLNDETPYKFIGTRMALMLSDEFRYAQIMKQNNTIIGFHK